MAKKLLFELSLFLYNFISIYTSKIIVIPFRSNISENNITNTSEKFLRKSLYTENLIGTPAQTININIFETTFSFYIGEKMCDKIPATYYKCSDSSSYIATTGIIEDEYYGEGFISQEFFSFYNSTNLKSNISSPKIKFFFKKNYRVTEAQQVCGDLGLKIKETYSDYDSTSSFIETVKRINLIDGYPWSYIFFEKDKNNKIKNINGISNEYIMKNYEGVLILGESPHQYESNKYNESDLINVVAAKRAIDLYWDLIFKNIYFLQKNNTVFNLNVSMQASLDINLNYIIAPFWVFQNITEYFFKEYLNNNKCKLNQAIKDFYNSTYISCNKKDFNNNDIKKFPTIFFEHVNYNYTFNLNFNDLFEEFNDSILFLIHSTDSNLYWNLGKIFLKKYKFVFNQNSKTIGFYKKNYNGQDENEEEIDNGKSVFEFLKNKNFWINFAWIMSCIVCLGLGAYFGHKYIKKEKKRRANELKDDDYDYSIQNNINE